MKTKIILSTFITIILIGVVFASGETTSTSAGKTGISSIIENIGNLILSLTGVEMTQGEDGSNLTFLDGGKVNLSGNIFENFTKGSSIILDKEGNITFADLIASKNTSFNLKGIGMYKILKGQRITYDGENATVYGKAGDFLGFKPEVINESGKDVGKLMNIKMIGSSLNISKGSQGSSILMGNFSLADSKILGIGNSSGKITISKDGKISEIWGGTNAMMKNTSFLVFGNNTLKMYYNESFNPGDHKGENYFNYGAAKIFVGGNGFTSDLTKSTNIYGDMQATKLVPDIGTKTRALNITMNGGNLEIWRDTSNSKDMAFNVNGDGDYVINNGRDIIYSEKIPAKSGESSGADEIFVKTNLGEGSSYGLSSSYNMNINNGEYTLKDNLFQDNKGDILVNANTPWENAVYVARNMDSKEANTIRTEMEKDSKMIYVDDPNFLNWIKGDTGEAIMKGVYTGTEISNQNKYGVEVTPLEVYGAMKSEGAGFKPGNGYTPFFEKYGIDPNMKIVGVEVGLTNSGSAQDIKTLKDGGFIPQDLDVTTSASYVELTGGKESPPVLKAKDVFTYFSGVLNYKKYLFQNDFKELYGEDAYNSLTPDEESYWTTYYFNAGEGSGKKALANRAQNYIAVWPGGRPELAIVGNPKFNSRLRTDFEEYVQELGLFNYP